MTLKKFDENQATMGNYISKPNRLTNKENIVNKKPKLQKWYLGGPVEPYNSASSMIKFVFVFLPHTSLTTFPILTLMKLTAYERRKLSNVPSPNKINGPSGWKEIVFFKFLKTN